MTCSVGTCRAKAVVHKKSVEVSLDLEHTARTVQFVPPGGTVLDPFAGSGTTLVAAAVEGFDAIGIEREQEYVDIIRRRLARPIEPVLFGGAA